GLLTFLDQRGLRAPGQVGRQHLESYLAELDRRGYRGDTRRRIIAAIKSFFSYLQDQGVVPVSPAHKVILPERERPKPRVLSEVEYKRLLAAVNYHTRDRALVELLLQTGMRLSELARLSIQDVELPQRILQGGPVGSVTILGKGRKTRTVTLNYKACRALRAWLDVRPAVDTPVIFLSKFRKPLSGRAIENVIAKYAQVAGIHDASPHTLRHTFATQHVKRGTKLDVVRQALGHSSLKTTSIYVELARDVMDKELQENAL